MKLINPSDKIGNLTIAAAQKIASDYKACTFIGASFSWQSLNASGREGWGKIPVGSFSLVDGHPHLWESKKHLLVTFCESVLQGQTSRAYFEK